MALWQANHVKHLIEALIPDCHINIIGLQTQGDNNTTAPIEQLGGKHVFVKELQKALLNQTADLAVHCIKDMSVHPITGLTTCAILPREDPRDALICEHPFTISSLPNNATIGTGSPRRSLLLSIKRPDLVIKLIRGNVNTRLSKLASKEYDAIILSGAGLYRINKAHLIKQHLPINDFIPAIGQGALGLECLSNNYELIELLQPLNDPISHQQITAEQTVNRILQGDCHSPIGAHAQYQQNRLTLTAIVGNLTTGQFIRHQAEGEANQPEKLGEQVGTALIQKGALQLLNQ